MGRATRYNDLLTCSQKFNFSGRIRCYSIVFKLVSSFLDVRHLQPGFQDEYVLHEVDLGHSEAQFQKHEPPCDALHSDMGDFQGITPSLRCFIVLKPSEKKCGNTPNMHCSHLAGLHNFEIVNFESIWGASHFVTSRKRPKFNFHNL